VPEDNEKEILRKIQASLIEIRSILVLINEEKLSQAKQKLLPQGSLKLQVYNSCDGSKTTQEIASALQKPESTIRGTLSDLRREGLVRSVDKEARQVHEQIF